MKDAVLIGLVIALAVSLFLLSRQYRKATELQWEATKNESVIRSLKEKNRALNSAMDTLMKEQETARKKAENGKKKLDAAKKKPEVKEWADESIPQDVLSVLRD